MSGGEAAAPLLRVLYVSRRVRGAEPGDVAAILAAAARNNPGRGITGALLADAASFGQALEGPPEAVEALFEPIQCDPRHHAVTLIEAVPAERRLFPAMTTAWHDAAEAAEALGPASGDTLGTLRLALARLSATAVA